MLHVPLGDNQVLQTDREKEREKRRASPGSEKSKGSFAGGRCPRGSDVAEAGLSGGGGTARGDREGLLLGWRGHKELRSQVPACWRPGGGGTARASLGGAVGWVLTVLSPLSPSGAQNRRRGRVEGRSYLHKSPGAVLASEITPAAWSPCDVQAHRASVLSCLPENPASACMTAVSWQWGARNFTAGSLCLVSCSGP